MIDRKPTKNLLAESMKTLAKIKSVEKITIQDIVQNCGLTKTTFYNHFRDKYDLIVWIYAEPIKDIVKKIDDKNFTLRDGITDILKYFVENKKFLLNVIKNTSGQNYFLNYVSQIHFTAFYNHLKSKSDKPLPPRIENLSKLYTFGTVQLICCWLIKEMPIPIDELAEILEAGLPEELKKILYED